MEDLYQVGSITQTHGIRGEVKVFPLTDDISRFKNMKNLLLDGGKDGYISLEVENARPQRILLFLNSKVLIISMILKNTRDRDYT